MRDDEDARRGCNARWIVVSGGCFRYSPHQGLAATLDRLTPYCPDPCRAHEGCLHFASLHWWVGAFLRKFRAVQLPMEIGQSYYYRREPGTSRLVKSKWRGPATCVTREKRRAGTTTRILGGTSLLRRSAEQVRPTTGDMGKSVVTNLQEAQRVLQGIRHRRVTTYTDLIDLPFPDAVADHSPPDKLGEEDDTREPAPPLPTPTTATPQRSVNNWIDPGST